MKIILNGSEYSAPQSCERLSDVLQHIQTSDAEQPLLIAHLKLNGRDMLPDSEETRGVLVSEIQTLEIETSTLSESILRNIDNAEEYLNKLLPGIERAAELFRSENELEANKFFIKIVDGIDWLSQVFQIVIAAQNRRPETYEINGTTIKARQDKLKELIQQMATANENQDWVLLADLLEYEIHPYYEEWHTLIPQLRNPSPGSQTH